MQPSWTLMTSIDSWENGEKSCYPSTTQLQGYMYICVWGVSRIRLFVDSRYTTFSSFSVFPSAESVMKFYFFVLDSYAYTYAAVPEMPVLVPMLNPKLSLGSSWVESTRQRCDSPSVAMVTHRTPWWTIWMTLSCGHSQTLWDSWRQCSWALSKMIYR